MKKIFKRFWTLCKNCGEPSPEVESKNWICKECGTFNE